MRRAAAVALLIFPSLARGGTYGEEIRTYAGFRASIDCSVGRMSDHRVEGERYRQKREAARARLEAGELQLQRMFRHFSTGKHPYARLRGLLDARELKDVPYEKTVRVEVGGIRVALYVTGLLDEARAAKLAADFIAAQLTAGGALATAGTGADDAAALAAVEELLVGALMSNGAMIIGELYRVLNEARRAEPAVRALAKLDGPVPIADQWLAPRARDGWMAAQIVACALDGKPYPAELHARLATLAAEPRASAIRLMALLLPDAQLAAGLTALHRDAAGDEPLTTWLDALAR